MKCVFIKSDKDLIFKKKEEEEIEEETAQRQCKELMTEMQAEMEEGCGRPFWSAPLCFDTAMQRRITLVHLNARFMAVTLQTHTSQIY